MNKIKQVIVMRKDLKMRKGKMIAQGAHASMKVFFDRLEETEICELDGSIENGFVFGVNEDEYNWIKGKFTKVCVSVDSKFSLLKAYAKARQANLPCSLIVDAGLTEFGGEPTVTCCAIGPGKSCCIDDITGDFKLL